MGTKNAGAKRVAKKVKATTPKKKKNLLTSKPVTAEQIAIIGNLLDIKIEEIRKASPIVHHSLIKGEHSLKQTLEVTLRSSRYHWHDLVFASALGIIVGFIISNL